MLFIYSVLVTYSRFLFLKLYARMFLYILFPLFLFLLPSFFSTSLSICLCIAQHPPSNAQTLHLQHLTEGMICRSVSKIRTVQV